MLWVYEDGLRPSSCIPSFFDDILLKWYVHDVYKSNFVCLMEIIMLCHAVPAWCSDNITKE